MTALVLYSPTRQDHARGALDRLIRIVRSEFDEMPGMRLTRAQCRRLWHITEPECDALVRHLVETGFLIETPRGIGRPPDY
jgi:hypothetical protein